MTFALVFSGQASQHPTMLPWLDADPRAADILHTMGQCIGTDWRSKLHDAVGRSNNVFAQVLITGTALAAWSTIKDQLLQAPAAVAGYSVGELAAYACAGVFAPAQAIALAQQRAALMDLAVRGMETGMVAVTGLSEDNVLALCVDLDLACAIRIHPTQCIFGGTVRALAEAAQRLQALGAGYRRLDIRVASHTPWTLPAAKQFAAYLANLPFGVPQYAIATNAQGSLCQHVDGLRGALSQQIASTVQWAACMEAIAERQVRCVLEIGAGSALAKMWNEQYPDIPARSLDEFQHPQAAVDWVRRRA
jgi:[acyl-carrier-protein] S-malonyltransferase